MRQFPHIKRNHRSGNWTYFRRFPSVLRGTLNRNFFERSLQTADRKAILEPWIAANREYETIVESARNQTATGVCSKAPNADIRPWYETAHWPEPWNGDLLPTQAVLDLKLEHVRAAIADWGKQERYNRAQKLLSDPSYSENTTGFEAECSIVGACGRERNWLVYSPQLLHLSRKILDQAKLDVPHWHGSMYIIERMIEAELRDILEAEARWRNFDYNDLPETPPSVAKALASAPNGQPYETLTSLVTKYTVATRKPLKTASKLKLVAKYINDIHGTEIRLNEITKDILLRLQTDALRLPARQTREERSTSFVALAAKHSIETSQRQTLTPQAVRSWFNLLSACINWGVRADLIEQNPTTGIKPQVRPLEERRRVPFSTTELRVIFSGDYYPTPQNPPAFWLPILALYTGARLNELGQLLRTDVIKGDIPLISINDQSIDTKARKRLKNLSARRTIPLHPVIIKLGFLDYVTSDNSLYLFPDLPHSGTYEPTKAFSQWFGRYLRKVGISDDRKVFHSFRHTFKDACRRANIEEEVHDALTGHGGGRSIGRSYGFGVPIETLALAIEKIDYGELPIITRCNLLSDPVTSHGAEFNREVLVAVKANQ